MRSAVGELGKPAARRSSALAAAYKRWVVSAAAIGYPVRAHQDARHVTSIKNEWALRRRGER